LVETVEGLLLEGLEVVLSFAFNVEIVIENHLFLFQVKQARELNADEEKIVTYRKQLAKIRQDLFFACGIWTLIKV
jgi:hypothetical protein